MMVTAEVWSGAKTERRMLCFCVQPSWIIPQIANLCEKRCVGHVCRINAGLVVLVVSATTSGSLIPHFNILVLIRKPSVFPHYCHLECFPVTFSLTRDLNCFLSEQEEKCRLCFAVNSRFPCFHLAAGIQTAFAFGTERMSCAKNS